MDVGGLLGKYVVLNLYIIYNYALVFIFIRIIIYMYTAEARIVISVYPYSA